MDTGIKSRTGITIYILLGIIALLLGGNAILFLTQDKSENQLITIREEKALLQYELNQVKSELDEVSTLNLQLNDKLTATHAGLKQKIDELQEALQNNRLTARQLENAKSAIRSLRTDVGKYVDDVDDLKKQKRELAAENSNLRSTVEEQKKKNQALNSQNQRLNEKITEAAALKIGNISVTTYRNTLSNGKLKSTETVRARRVNNIRIEFSFVANKIARNGTKEVFLQVFDHQGDLIAPVTGQFFHLGNNALAPYTEKTIIYYSPSNPVYGMEWKNEKGFEKGNYQIRLFVDGEQTGEASFQLD